MGSAVRRNATYKSIKKSLFFAFIESSFLATFRVPYHYGGRRWGSAQTFSLLHFFCASLNLILGTSSTRFENCFGT